MNQNLYEILGLEKDASPSLVKKAYRRKSSENHPDRKPDGHDGMAEINKAYAILSDPEKRKNYDETDSTQTASREDRVNNIFQEFLFQTSENCSSVHETITRSEHLMKEAISKAKTLIFANRHELRILEKKQKGYVFKGKGADLFGMRLSGKIESVVKTINKIEDEISLVEEAMKLLIEYEATDFPPNVPVQVFGNLIMGNDVFIHPNNPFLKHSRP